MALAGVETPKYEELCRLCATKTTMVLAIHIFENEGAIRQINNKIHSCLPIKVNEADQLPKMICENCLYKLELFYDFRERTVRTEKLLIQLYREIISNISNVQLNNEIHQSCMVSLDNSELIMVEHQELVDYQNLENVSNISLPAMEHCADIIVENQINLGQESINLKSFNSIDINSHNLDPQDHSSASLQIQESSLLTSSDTQESHIQENLHLIQENHSFTDQIDFQLNIEDSNVRDITNVENVNVVHSNPHQKLIPSLKRMDYGDIKFEDSSLNDINLNVLRLSNIYRDRSHCDIESLKQEDSNSGGSLHIVSQINDIYQQHNNASNSNSLEGTNNLKNSDHTSATNHIDGLVKEQSSKHLYNTESQSNEESLVVLSQTEDWYYCDICGISCNNKSEFETHCEIHIYKCKTCMAVFTSAENLNCHMKEVHFLIETSDNAENQKSVIETEQTDADTSVSEPVDDGDNDSTSNDIKKTNSPKKCQECGKVYKTNYKLLQHMRKHTGEKPFKCKSCEKTFRSKIGLAQHEAKHTGQYEFSCPTCGKGFQCRSYLTVHQRVHSSVKPFPCTTCGQNFKTKQSLLDHTNRHLGVKPFICNVCGRGFITNGVCRAHQKTHTGSDNRKFLCKVCNKMFVSKSYLRTHLRIHTGEKPFVCEVCGKRFLTKVDLKVHSTLHTGEKSYTCEICGKAFARNDALRCHRRSHTGERPYSCDICGQTFTQFTPMAIHKRLHTGERPYICEVCGKTFVSKSTMMSHAKKHV